MWTLVEATCLVIIVTPILTLGVRARCPRTAGRTGRWSWCWPSSAPWTATTSPPTAAWASARPGYSPGRALDILTPKK